MDFTISLAHFCEVHGPTSIICTQASTLPCSSCNPCVTPPSDDVPPSAYSYNGLYDQPTLKLCGRLPQLTSPFESPPTSPRSPTHNPYFPSFGSDSSFGSRRPSSNFDPEPDICENCQIIVPKQYSDRLPSGAPGSPSKDGRGRNGSPVLRSTQNFPVRSSMCSEDLTSSSDSSDASDTEQSKSFDSTGSKRYPGSIPRSPIFASRGMHTHTLAYITTSQPQSPATYSRLRRTCIRALSTESLPAGKSSGPMMFGDSVAGYTIAYVFRLQDPRSRGAKRTYALIAMAGRDCRRATRAMVKVTGVFEGIANLIVARAESVLARESAASQYLSMSRPATAIPRTPPFKTSTSSMPVSMSPQKERHFSSVASSPATRNITPVSSFLSAKKVDPDGFPRVSRDVMKAKNLTEIVGQEGFFVDLHASFSGLLHNLIKEFGS
ncbi:vesicle coat protein [Massariosphaeria phaeospora]|uniref:Vesicle coat protein n=1 Tax=Massariosphaeria phaeospora TaxID=100035 RepID=A0A7C8M6N5_9PLEO|nr:vesicle coat protein [Massariosphaeria phaeospora]